MRVIAQGEESGREWRIVEVEDAPFHYVLQEIFTPTDPMTPRTWKRTPLMQDEVWASFPEERPLMLAPRTTTTRSRR